MRSNFEGRLGPDGGEGYRALNPASNPGRRATRSAESCTEKVEHFFYAGEVYPEYSADGACATAGSGSASKPG